jgi:hypothetical protein
MEDGNFLTGRKGGREILFIRKPTKIVRKPPKNSLPPFLL